jgi:hypothetical protein
MFLIQLNNFKLLKEDPRSFKFQDFCLDFLQVVPWLIHLATSDSDPSALQDYFSIPQTLFLHILTNPFCSLFPFLYFHTFSEVLCREYVRLVEKRGGGVVICKVCPFPFLLSPVLIYVTRSYVGRYAIPLCMLGTAAP